MKKVDLLRNVSIVGRPFVPHVKQKEVISNFDLVNMFESGHHFSLSDVMNYGYIKIMGYLYNVSPFLRQYIVKTDYGIYEYYAPNKTLLRKAMTGHIYYIKEI